MSRVTVAVDGLSLVHEDSGGVSTATLPDVCLTPPGAVPVAYSNVARSKDLASGTSRVRADGHHRIAVAGSTFARSTGGEAGAGGGVTSGTSNAEASFLSHSFDVAIEGRGACRLTDKMIHNRGNTLDCGGVTQAGAGNRPVAGASARKRPGQAAPRKAAGSRRIQRFGIDTNLGYPAGDLDIAYCKKRHVHFVARYLCHDRADLHHPATDPPFVTHPPITREEMRTLHHAKFKIVAIWELSKHRAIELNSPAAQKEAGIHDAKRAHAKMEELGHPGKPVYFTVDFGVDGKTWRSTKNLHTLEPIPREGGRTMRNRNLILSYFEGINSVLGVERTGAYGAVFTMAALFRKGLIRYAWQWAFPRDDGSYPRTDHRCQILQTAVKEPQSIDGVNVWGVAGLGALDLDLAVQADFGQW